MIVVGLALLAVGHQAVSNTINIVKGVETSKTIRALVLVAVSTVGIFYTTYLADIIVEDIACGAARAYCGRRAGLAVGQS